MRSCGKQLELKDDSTGNSDVDNYLQLHGAKRPHEEKTPEKMAAMCAAAIKIQPTNRCTCDAWTTAKYAFTHDSISIVPPIRICCKRETQTSDFDRKTAISRGVIYQKSSRDGASLTTRKGLSPNSFIVVWISICLLSELLLLAPVCSQSTVKMEPGPLRQPNNCHEKCICIYGDNKDRIMEYVLTDEQQLKTWESLGANAAVYPLTTVLCSNALFKSVPAGLTADVDVLFLDGNQLTSVAAFDLLPSLNDTSLSSPVLVLSMSKNEISSISAGSFEATPQLKILILRDNSLKNLNWTVAAAPTLQHLVGMDLAMNKIKIVDEQSLGTFEELRRLDLSRNLLHVVDSKALLKFPKLEFLDLSSNRLTVKSIESDDSFIPVLHTISLANNRLDNFSPLVTEFLSRIYDLQSLDLSGNRQASGRIVSENFEGLFSLKFLNLSNCGIVTLNQGWLNGGPHQSLVELDLSKNYIISISAHAVSAVFSIGPYPGTVAYDFSRVPEDLVEKKWLRPLEKLKTLRLSENRALTTIEDDAFDYLPRLRHLFLQNCAIRRLNIASARYRYGAEAVARTLPSLTNVWFYGNPLECDCYVRVVKRWSTATGGKRFIDAPSYITNNTTQAINIGIAMCASPVSIAGQPVMTTPAEDMICQLEPYSIVIAMLIGPLTFAASILLTIVCGSFHVCIVKMKKGAVQSYHSREGAMRKSRNNTRRGAQPDPIMSSFSWSRPSPSEDRKESPRALRHTNIVLGNLGAKKEERSRRPHGGNFLAVPGMSHAGSLSSLDGPGDQPAGSRNSVGYCSGTDIPKHDKSFTPLLVVSAAGGSSCNLVKTRNHSDGDSVIGRESMRSHSASSDIPFIDEIHRNRTADNRAQTKPCSDSSERPLLGSKQPNSSSALSPSVSTLSAKSASSSGRFPRSVCSQTLLSETIPSNGRTLPVQVKSNSEEESSV